MNIKRFGVDIGTMNIRVSDVDTGRIISEKNAIAVKDNKIIIGTGDIAYEMYEKAPSNVEICFPVTDGVVCDLGKMQFIFEYLYKILNNDRIIKGSEFLISVPTDATEVERRAFHEIIAKSKVKPKDLSVIEKCVADLVGLGIDIRNPEGNMIINIGAGKTDISVLSFGGIVLSKSLNIGGNKINENIIQAIRNEYGAQIGMKTAEQLKFAMTDLTLKNEGKEFPLFARALDTALPVKIAVKSGLVSMQAAKTLFPIIETVKLLLEKTPPELASDIRLNGIYLIGGSSNMKNIEIMFGEATGLRIKTVASPEENTIRGITKVCSSPRYDSTRFYPSEKEYI